MLGRREYNKMSSILSSIQLFCLYPMVFLFYLYIYSPYRRIDVSRNCRITCPRICIIVSVLLYRCFVACLYCTLYWRPISFIRAFFCQSVCKRWSIRWVKLSWSACIKNSPNCKYDLHCCTARRIVRNSFSYTDKVRLRGPKALLTYTNGWPFWERTTPMPTLQVSVSTTNCSAKLGSADTGAVTSACFRIWKAVSSVTVHW
jgi:hypothetical protein